jgi:hypothetical protein
MTTMPRSLEERWRGVPYAPQAGSIEERVEALIKMHRKTPREIPSNFLKVFAWDLMCAGIDEKIRPWPSMSMERLMMLALGLPPGHSAGWWHYFNRPPADHSGKRPSKYEHPDIYDGRGGWDEKALLAALIMELEYFFRIHEGWFKKRITLAALERRMRAAGFKTARSTLSKWRLNSYYQQKPSSPVFALPPPEEITLK